MKKTLIIAIAFLTLTASPIFSVSTKLKSQLLEKALIEGAVTKEQKTAVATYLMSVAAQNKNLADSYREMAVTNYGGKAVAQNLRSKKYLEMAKSLDSLAASYESLAENYSVEEYQKLANLSE